MQSQSVSKSVPDSYKCLKTPSQSVKRAIRRRDAVISQITDTDWRFSPARNGFVNDVAFVQSPTFHLVSEAYTILRQMATSGGIVVRRQKLDADEIRLFKPSIKNCAHPRLGTF